MADDSLTITCDNCGKKSIVRVGNLKARKDLTVTCPACGESYVVDLDAVRKAAAEAVEKMLESATKGSKHVIFKRRRR